MIHLVYLAVGGLVLGLVALLGLIFAAIFGYAGILILILLVLASIMAWAIGGMIVDEFGNRR